MRSSSGGSSGTGRNDSRNWRCRVRRGGGGIALWGGNGSGMGGVGVGIRGGHGARTRAGWRKRGCE